MEVVLQCRERLAKLLEIRITHSAEMAVFKCDRIALVFARADRIHSDEFASHVETGNLVASVTVLYARFQEPAVDYIQRRKCRLGVMNVFVRLY